MAKVNCTNCGQEVYKKPTQIKNSKHGRFYCNTECKNAYRKQLKREEVEERIGQDLEEYIYQKYIIEKKSSTWIKQNAKIHSHYLTNCFKEFGITTRDKVEQFNVWRDNLSEEEQIEYINMLSKRASKNLNGKVSRKKLRVVMGSEEYRNKISKANSGINNGMHDPTLSKEHRIETRALFGYKKWAKQVKERDNYICQKCNKKGNSKTLHAHHINDYYTNKQGRMDLDNAVTLCNSCHSKYHNAHKGMPSTEELFNEYMKS